MNKYLKTFIFDCIALGVMYSVYLNPEYGFFLKTYWWTISILTIIISIWIIGQFEELQSNPSIVEFIKVKKSAIYKHYDIITDLIYLACFVLLDYKVIFVLYTITLFFKLCVYGKINEKK